jgi:micrococcal nuclease
MDHNPDKINFYKSQVSFRSEASKIELRNPQRVKYFRIVSEMWIDGESLADMLKAKGLAKDYDGEGARPVW